MAFRLDRSIEVLRNTPAALQGLLGGLSNSWTRTNYGKDTFSPFDVVGHLIHADRTNWMTRVNVILRHGEAEVFPAFDRFAMYETSEGKAMAALLTEFAQVRAESLEALQKVDLTPDLLALRGTHPSFGTVTLQQLLSTWVVHDLSHVRQIVRSMAFQYRDEVGPWLPNLAILRGE